MGQAIMRSAVVVATANTKIRDSPTPMQGGEPVLRTGMLVGGGH